MLVVRPEILVKLAALVWYSGVMILWGKSISMIIEAAALGSGPEWAGSAVLSGLGLGLVKSKYLFSGICKKNITRIYTLQTPKIWQFYRTRFYFFLALMIGGGNWAYGLAQGRAGLLLSLAVLEISVATALFVSGKWFYKNWNQNTSAR